MKSLLLITFFSLLGREPKDTIHVVITPGISIKVTPGKIDTARIIFKSDTTKTK